MVLAIDLLNPSIEHEKRTHKLKRLVASPNSFFMDIKCQVCGSCSTVLCTPTGGLARLTEGCAVRKKTN